MNPRNLAAALVLAVPLAASAEAPALPAIVNAKCILCHGEKGESSSEGFPRLAAQHESYLAKQLRDFLSGERTGIMVRMAKGLSAEDVAAIARYYSTQPPAPPSGTPTELAAVGKYIYQHGNSYAGIPACKGCHGDAAHGTAQLPRLAGQHATYLERQVKDFSQRKRTNDNEVMHAVAEKLTALETRAVAEYISTLP